MQFLFCSHSMETITEAVSSSSESESGSEEEKNETVSDRVSDISDIQQGSDGGDGENEQEAADDEIASAVASASQKADKFLQDSDSEVEESTENAEVSGQPSSPKTSTDMQNVFGVDDSDEEDSNDRGKRQHSPVSEDAENQSPTKRRRLDSDVEEGESSGLVDQREEEEEEAVFGGQVDSGGEESDDKEESDEEEEEEGGSGSGTQLQEEEVTEFQAGQEEEEEDDKKLLQESDWDLMMARRKEAMARARRKKKRDGDLTAHDDFIMSLIQQMREAAEEDKQLNVARKAATKKIQLLPTLVAHLKRADLQTNFIECGILSALAEWLSPLPDHSLPHLKIRESILEILHTLPIRDTSFLKSSKIGKAVMLLYRHPKESKKNREKAGRIINEWARPIFGLASDFKSMTRDEREERDYANLARHRNSTGERRPSQDDEAEQPQKPGDKGWIGRARVPMPSTKGYVVRPKWNTEMEFRKRGGGKKTLDRYEKHLRKKKQEKMQGKVTHAVPISIEGRRMPL